MVPRDLRIAIIIPCLNEALSVGKVIDGFRAALPEAAIYVVDNGSTDATATVAAAHAAHVITERRRGKGSAVRTAFRLIDADVYVLVDGDETYPASAINSLVAPILAGDADMVVGSRIMPGTGSQFHLLNRIGNVLFPWFLRLLLRKPITDILSGYRAMSREFVRQVPLASRQFEIEAELTIKAIERSYRLLDVPIATVHRPEGSESKLRIFHDGSRILWTMVLLFRDYRPLTFFGGLGLVMIGVALVPGTIVVAEFTRTGHILRLPSAVLSVGLMLCGMLSIAIGLILGAISRRFLELEYKLDMHWAERLPVEARQPLTDAEPVRTAREAPAPKREEPVR